MTSSERWACAMSAGMALVCSACGTPRVLAARPLPVVLSPPNSSWGLSVSVEPEEELHVRLVNESSEPVSVLWQESAYIDIDNRSHPIVLTTSQQPRSTVAPGTRLEENVVPISQAGDNPLDPLLPIRHRAFEWLRGSEKRPRIGSRIGSFHPLLNKEIGLFLVLERAGERKTLLAKYVIEETRRR